MNPCYLRIANTAVGNIDSAAALELTSPTRLRATKDLLLALVGEASLVIDGTRLPSGTVAAAGAGEAAASPCPRAGDGDNQCAYSRSPDRTRSICACSRGRGRSTCRAFEPACA